MIGLSTLAIAASLAAVVTASHGHDLHARGHSKHVRRAFSGMGTYYITGLGACGQYNNPGDKIVALNSAQYGGGYPGPQCFKMVRICDGGNCHNAQIVDECPTCAYGSLDMSQSLFEQFHPTDVGTFPITWTFLDGSNDDQPTTTKKPTPTSTWKEPEPTTTWKPEPTTTWEPETTTSKKKKTTTSPPPETTSTPEPTTTSEAPTTTSTAEVQTTAPASVSAAATSAPATTTAGSGSGSASNFADANQIMLALGKMAVVANGGE